MHSNKIKNQVLCEKVLFRDTDLLFFFFSHSLIVTLTFLLLFYFDLKERMCLKLYFVSRNLL